QTGHETWTVPEYLKVSHTMFKQTAREDQHVVGRRKLRGQHDPPRHASARDNTGQAEPPEWCCFQQATGRIPKTERCVAEPVREGNLEELTVTGGPSDVAVRCEPVRVERRADEARPIIECFPIPERCHAAVDAVTAA